MRNLAPYSETFCQNQVSLVRGKCLSRSMFSDTDPNVSHYMLIFYNALMKPIAGRHYSVTRCPSSLLTEITSSLWDVVFLRDRWLTLYQGASHVIGNPTRVVDIIAMEQMFENENWAGTDCW